MVAENCLRILVSGACLVSAIGCQGSQPSSKRRAFTARCAFSKELQHREKVAPAGRQIRLWSREGAIQRVHNEKESPRRICESYLDGQIQC